MKAKQTHFYLQLADKTTVVQRAKNMEYHTELNCDKLTH